MSNSTSPDAACPLLRDPLQVAGREPYRFDRSFALLSRDVYEARGQGADGWLPVSDHALRELGISPHRMSDAKSGFQARLYAHETRGYVLAFRGTDEAGTGWPTAGKALAWTRDSTARPPHSRTSWKKHWMITPCLSRATHSVPASSRSTPSTLSTNCAGSSRAASRPGRHPYRDFGTRPSQRCGCPRRHARCVKPAAPTHRLAAGPSRPCALSG